MYSKSKLSSAAKTVEYFRDSFEHSIDSPEATQGERAEAMWVGKGAAMLGLTGTPQAADLDRVLRGIVDGQKVQDGFNQATGTFKHTPGYDFTFSPDKTISIAAGPQGDERISELMLAAAKVGFEYAEANAALVQDRDGEHNTGNLVCMMTLHKTTRTVDGRADPQWHVHMVIANVTYDERSSTWRAVDFGMMITPAFRKEMDRVAGAALTEMLHGIGYETEPSKTGLGPALKGYTDAQCAEFSGRSIKQRDPALRMRGIDPSMASPRAKQLAILFKREAKPLQPWAEIQADWRERAIKVGLTLDAAPAYALPDQDRVNAAADLVLDRWTDVRDHAVDLREDLHNREDVKAAVTELNAASEQAEPMSVFTWNKEIRAVEPEATRDQIKAATAEALDAGELHRHENGKLSIEDAEAYGERKHAEGEKIEQVTYQQVANEVARAVAGMSIAQERNADLRQKQRDLEKVLDSEQAQALKDNIKATRDASTLTNKGIAASVRENLKYAKSVDIEKAIKELVTAGVLEGKALTKKTGENVLDKQGKQIMVYSTPMDEARMQQRVDAAIEKVLAKAEHARDDMQHQIADMQSMVNSRDFRRADAIASSIRDAERVMSGTLKGWTYQVSQAAPGATKEMVQGAIDRAIAGGRLHSQVGRLSVETEAQTDRRLSQTNALREKAKSVDRDIKAADRKHERNEQRAERKVQRQERKAAYEKQREDYKKARIGMGDIMKVKLTGRVYLLDNWLTAGTREQAKYKAVDWRLAVVIKAVYATIKVASLTVKAGIMVGKGIRGAYRLNKAVGEYRADKQAAGTLEPLKERQQMVADYLKVAESRQACERAQKQLDGLSAEKEKLTKAVEAAKADHELIKTAAGEKSEMHGIAEKMSEAKLRATEKDLAAVVEREQKAIAAVADAKFKLDKAQEATAAYGDKQPDARHMEQLRGEHDRISAAMEKAQAARNKLDAGEKERSQAKSRYINQTRGLYTFGEGLTQRRAAFTPSALIGHLMVHSGNKLLGDIGIKMAKVSTVRDPWERALSIPLATFSKGISLANKGYAAVAERVAEHSEVASQEKRVALFAAALSGDEKAMGALKTLVTERDTSLRTAAEKATYAYQTGKGSEWQMKAANNKQNRAFSTEALDKLAKKYGQDKWQGEDYSKLLTADLTEARKQAGDAKDALRVAERELKSAEKAGTATMDQHVAALAAKDNADKLGLRAEAVAIVQRQWLDVDTRQLEKINTAITDHRENAVTAASVAAGKTQDLAALYKQDEKVAVRGKDQAWFKDGPQQSAVQKHDVEQMTEKLRSTPAANDAKNIVDSWKSYLRGEGARPVEPTVSNETKAQADAQIIQLREQNSRAVEAAVTVLKSEQKPDNVVVPTAEKATVINMSEATKEIAQGYKEKLRDPVQAMKNASAEKHARFERNLEQSGSSLDDVGRGREAAKRTRSAGGYSF